MTEADDLLVPPGTRLVHIGPHKTGTTAIQWSFHTSREELGRYGVHYAGAGDQAYLPAVSLLRGRGRLGTGHVSPQVWDDLVAEVEQAGPQARSLISSETLSNAREDAIVRLRDTLGPERVRIVRMVRRYDLLMPSQWQQSIAGGRRWEWPTYCRRAFEDPEHRFWRRHHFAAATQRWCDVVGADRVTVVVVDDSSRHWLLRVMERMTGLPPGFLQSGSGHANRSMTRAEAELLLPINSLIRKRAWDPRVHLHYARHGVKDRLKAFPADPEGGRESIPAAWHERLAEITAEHVAQLQGLGVRIVGDLAWLTPDPSPEAIRPERVALPTPNVAAAAVIVTSRARPDLPVVPAEQDDTALQPPAHQRTDVVAPQLFSSRVRLTAVQPGAQVLVEGLTSAAVSPGRLRSGLRRVLVVVPPLHDLLLGWQQHLAGGGTDPLAKHAQPWRSSAARTTEQVTAALRRATGVLIVPLDRPETAAIALERCDAGIRLPLDLPGERLADADALDAVRELNMTQEWSHAEHQRYVAGGFLPWLTAAPTLPRVTTVPADVAANVTAAADALAATIEAAGVPVLGEMAELHPAAVQPAGHTPRLESRAAGTAVAGVLARTDPRFG